ncbi:MAG: hypothetical protein HY367_02970 [Candidatus Aenigmarchaeota archaeon]|nr:hypothetical protein [Candidatus Aenigmarchaeota archaeon]
MANQYFERAVEYVSFLVERGISHAVIRSAVRQTGEDMAESRDSGHYYSTVLERLRQTKFD